ncbi:MAG: Gfo/Idh/MocA family oxidoreductase [Pseudomonadota bacterium]
MPLRYAIIGSGMMGCEHIRNIALMKDAEVVAVADPNAAMAEAGVQTAERSGIGRPKCFTDHRDLLSANLADAYVIAAPNDTHFEICRHVFATNKPVLLEKPSATRSDHAWDLVRLAEQRSAPVWVAMEYRYMPPVARMLEALKSGQAGRPHMLSIVEHRFPFLDKVDNWNRFSARTGGTLVEKCCHFFDLMRLLTASEATRIYATGAQSVNDIASSYDGKPADTLDNAMVVVDFENGMRASLDLCMFAEGSYWQEQISVVGDAAKLEAKIPGPSRFWPGGAERASQFILSPRVQKAPVVEEIEQDPTILAAGDHHGSTFYQHQKFAEMIRSGGKPEVTIIDGAMAVDMGIAAQRSIETGQAQVLGYEAEPLAGALS